MYLQQQANALLFESSSIIIIRRRRRRRMLRALTPRRSAYLTALTQEIERKLQRVRISSFSFSFQVYTYTGQSHTYQLCRFSSSICFQIFTKLLLQTHTHMYVCKCKSMFLFFSDFYQVSAAHIHICGSYKTVFEE